MIQLIFATNNKHKVEEIKSVIAREIEVISLQQAGIKIDIPEPHATLTENATEKSRRVHELTRVNCFSEDTGLEVLALQGEPGIKSARYAGEEKSSEKNIAKLLLKLGNCSNRRARFRTVISLIFNNHEYFFEGVCEGDIMHAPRGEKGFGYDSVFKPRGSDKTFAEMATSEKNIYSHRRKAAGKLVAFLQKQIHAENQD
jgi:XTP/dITP diphosphohydrolase